MATSLVLRQKIVPTYVVFHHGIYQSSEICINLWNFAKKFWNFDAKRIRPCHHLINFVMRGLSNVLSVRVLVVCITYTINFSSFKVINELRRDVHSGFSNLYFHKAILLIRNFECIQENEDMKKKSKPALRGFLSIYSIHFLMLSTDFCCKFCLTSFILADTITVSHFISNIQTR